MDDLKKGLILTMGFSPQPLIFAIEQYGATHAVFIGTSPSLNKSLDSVIEATKLQPSKWTTKEVVDSPDSIGALCIAFGEAHKWLLEKGVAIESISADPTGGKKWMSSGAVMAASFLGIPLVYIDVELDENKIPIKETMKLVPLGNAYDQTGFVIGDQGRTAFNAFDFEGAAIYFERIRPTLSHRAELFEGLANISKILAKWDRFEHYERTITEDLEMAISGLERSLKTGAGTPNLFAFVEELRRLVQGIQELEGKKQLSQGFILDLLLNAGRRANLHRYDDAIARLYRTLEAISQYALKTIFSIDTGNVIYDHLDPKSIDLFKSRIKRDELPRELDLFLGSTLLFSLGHPVGKNLFSGQPGKEEFSFKRLLLERNNSILAHGFNPIQKEVFTKFKERIKAILIEVYPEEFNYWDSKLRIPQLPPLGV